MGDVGNRESSNLSNGTNYFYLGESFYPQISQINADFYVWDVGEKKEIRKWGLVGHRISLILLIVFMCRMGVDRKVHEFHEFEEAFFMLKEMNILKRLEG